MIFVGNLKPAQFTKLFIMLQYHLMQNFRIFGAREGIHFEFTSFTWFWKIWKKKKLNRVGPTGQPHYPNSGAQPRASLQTVAATMLQHP
jgi:hypothetical protein